jgi:hypothetical protein
MVFLEHHRLTRDVVDPKLMDGAHNRVSDNTQSASSSGLRNPQ